MAQFATAAELAELLGVEPFTGLALAQANALLEIASSRIQEWTRQTIELVTDDVVTVVGGLGLDLELPERPVVSVSAVDLGGVAVAADSWTLRGAVLHRATGWGTDTQLVTVTYTHGWAVIPQTIRDATLLLAARARVNPTPGVTSESIGNYSVTYADGGSSPADTEMLSLGLGRYRRRHASLRVGVIR